ncbi:MAG: DUF3568 family protein [Oligosphaeraceae bacterium]
MKNLLSLLALSVVATMVLASCIQVQPAPASGSLVANERYGRISGVYSASLGCNILDADKAVRAAAKTLILRQLSRDNQTSFISYEYKDVYDARISVVLKLDAQEQVTVDIKFSKTGDREFSQKFLAAIEEQLRAQE